VASIVYPSINAIDHTGTSCSYWGPFIFDSTIGTFARKKKSVESKEDNIKVK